MLEWAQLQESGSVFEQHETSTPSGKLKIEWNTEANRYVLTMNCTYVGAYRTLIEAKNAGERRLGGALGSSTSATVRVPPPPPPPPPPPRSLKPKTVRNGMVVDQCSESQSAYNQGLEAAARLVDRKVDAYVDSHCSYDAETGATECPGDGDAWILEMHELVEEIRHMKRK